MIDRIMYGMVLFCIIFLVVSGIMGLAYIFEQIGN